jgi:hypothetical protein
MIALIEESCEFDGRDDQSVCGQEWFSLGDTLRWL